MAKPDVLTVRLKVVTPMFLGGADPNAQAELRPPSIKGVLRWWYRALHPELNWAEEAKIFGWGGDHARQCPFSIRVSQAGSAPVSGEAPGKKAPAYLGYGVIGRPYVAEGTELSVELVWRPGYAERHSDGLREVLRALWALCHLGGLGSRWRRGFGSVVLSDVAGPTWLKELAKEELGPTQGPVEEVIAERLKDLPARRAAPGEHTCVSREARFLIKRVSGDAAEALGEADCDFRFGRSNSSHPRYPGARLYAGDTATVVRFLKEAEAQIAGRERPQWGPVRGVVVQVGKPLWRATFGLPHNYFFKRRGELARVETEAVVFEQTENGPGRKAISRRASPLLLHVHPADSGTTLVLSFMPSRVFLPAGARLTYRARPRDKEWWVEGEGEAPHTWQPVLGFLEWLKRRGWQEVGNR
ncbi:MAG: type III-B CRISPR module RAMP protein Cmr1 [Armatimonadetes bacterium]|nr:type III-B CRISPR module RAMP protein Cmr1 [Armatimonadota bacterium]